MKNFRNREIDLKVSVLEWKSEKLFPVHLRVICSAYPNNIKSGYSWNIWNFNVNRRVRVVCVLLNVWQFRPDDSPQSHTTQRKMSFENYLNKPWTALQRQPHHLISCRAQHSRAKELQPKHQLIHIHKVRVYEFLVNNTMPGKCLEHCIHSVW